MDRFVSGLKRNACVASIIIIGAFGLWLTFWFGVFGLFGILNIFALSYNQPIHYLFPPVAVLCVAGLAIGAFNGFKALILATKSLDDYLNNRNVDRARLLRVSGCCAVPARIAIIAAGGILIAGLIDVVAEPLPLSCFFVALSGFFMLFKLIFAHWAHAS